MGLVGRAFDALEGVENLPPGFPFGHAASLEHIGGPHGIRPAQLANEPSVLPCWKAALKVSAREGAAGVVGKGACCFRPSGSRVSGSRKGISERP